jgi:putative GTP pyrophosphokinase
MEKTERIISEYDSKLKLFETLTSSSLRLILSLLQVKNIKQHQITSRIKDRVSLENKIIKKNYKYSNLGEITDIVGIRIITYFEDEIDIIATLIEENFQIDFENSVDKRKVEDDRFGYKSLHYIVSYKNDRINLPEYKSFDGLKFEIQIRSILQHSWAEIEHDIGYKGEKEIPKSALRTFYRVAALLEQADLEFVKLKNSIKEHENGIKDSLSNNMKVKYFDKATIYVFATQSKEVKQKETDYASKNNLSIIETLDDYVNEEVVSILTIINDDFLKRVKLIGINSIEELENAYLRFIDKILEKDKNKHQNFIKGASILWLINYMERMNVSYATIAKNN